MSENANARIDDMGKFSLVPGAPSGWDSVSLFKTNFIRNFFLVSFVLASLSGVLWYFIHIGILDLRFSAVNRIIACAYLIAGVVQSGEYRRNRLLEFIVFATISFIVELCFFYNKLFIAIFYFPISSWLLFLWMYRYPDMMDKLGIRKIHFITDVSRGFGFAVVMLGLSAFWMYCYGKSLSFDFLPLAARTSSDLSFQLIFFTFIFSVSWGLKNMGAGILKRTIIIYLLCLVQQFPVLFSFFLTGDITFNEMLLGTFGNSFLIVFSITMFFNVLKNIIPAAMLQTSIMLVAEMMGVV